MQEVNSRCKKAENKWCYIFSIIPENLRWQVFGSLLKRSNIPLYFKPCPPGTNPHAAPVTPSRKFDIGRIPVMDLLVSHGADVNQKEESKHMVPGYPIMYAIMAGAVERVNWLLEHGANPELKGSYGSAVGYVEAMGSEKIKRVVEEGVKARKWFDPKETNSTQ